jgi:hypothetical protein
MADAEMGLGVHENLHGWLGTWDEHGYTGLFCTLLKDRPRVCVFSASASVYEVCW